MNNGMQTVRCVICVVALCAIATAAQAKAAPAECIGGTVMPLGDNAPARVDGEGRYVLPADFSTLRASRAAWDFPMRLHLGDADGISFDWRCSDVALCTGFNVYLRSGKGWYTARFDPEDTNCWQRITVTKDAMLKTEGDVAGWDAVDALRLGMWRGAKGRVEFGFANLSVVPRGSQKPDVEASATKTPLDDAACRAAMLPRSGEWRAFWIHAPLVKGKARDWDGDVGKLKAHGFNAVLPNLAYAGTAFYRSSVLPVHPSVESEGDSLDAYLVACRRHGVECHVWNICWKTGRYAGKAFLERMKAEGRMQRGFGGESKELWLCPTHPANRTMEVESFVELAKKGVDGVHFDYIRYPGPDYCFCDRCRALFEAQIGRRVERWPTDVRSDSDLAARWNAFRCAAVSALVKAVSARIRRDYPGVKLSAAVFSSPDLDPARIGQPWVEWCKEGVLDFACPMNYNDSCIAFRGLVRAQREAVGEVSTKLRPGIGLSCWQKRYRPRDAVILARQIGIVRDAGLDGFCVFDLDARSMEATEKFGNN